MRHSLVPLLTAAAIAFGFACAGSTAAKAESVMAACAGQWKQAQAAGTTGGETWPQFLAQCRKGESSAAAPSSGFAPAPAGPSARAGHAVRLPVPLVAAVAGPRAGIERQYALGPPRGRIHDRIGGPRQLPIRHRCVGQHPVARLSLCGNPLLRAHQAGRVHVRGQRASGWKSRRAQRASDPFGIRAGRQRTPTRGVLVLAKEKPRQRGVALSGA